MFLGDGIVNRNARQGARTGNKARENVQGMRFILTLSVSGVDAYCPEQKRCRAVSAPGHAQHFGGNRHVREPAGGACSIRKPYCPNIFGGRRGLST